MECDDAAAALLGFPGPAAVVDSISLFGLCEDEAVAEALRAWFAQAGSAQTLDASLHIDAGAAIRVRICGRVDADGEAAAIFLTDATPDARQGAVLRDRAARADVLTEAIGGLICVLSMDRQVEFMNDALIERVGRDSTGERCPEALGAMAWLMDTEVVEPVLTGRVVRQEVKCPTDDRWFLAIYSPMERPDQTAAVHALYLDITEYRQMQRDLHESEARFVQVAHSIQDVFWIYDTQQGIFVYASPAYETLWGRPVEALYDDAASWLDAVHPEDYPRVAEAFEPDKVSQVPELQYRIVRPDMSTSLVWERRIPIRDEHGRVYRVVGLAQDTTKCKYAEQVLLQTSRMEAASVLATGIAHQMSNLMLGVMGNAEILGLGQIEPPESMEMLGEVAAAGQDCGHLARLMLSYARCGSAQPKLLDLNETVREIVRLQALSQPASVRVECRMEPGLAKIDADPIEIGQAVVALCQNAVDAMEGPGTITITTHNVHVTDSFAAAHPDLSSGSHVCLTVEDTGCGMGPDTLRRIFEPFFTTKYQARGLGLPAVNDIVQRHQGYVVVHSHQGAGTIAQIYLPSCKAEAQPPQTEEPPIVGGTETVLVVDDEELACRVMARMLKHLGYHALTATNGPEALDIARADEHDVALVILDLRMPGMGGAEVYHHLKAIQPDMPVIVCSGNEHDESAQALLSAGADALVQKPFKMRHMAVEVRRAIEARRDRTASD